MRFSYIAPPSVTSIAPTSGPAAGGTTVTVTGSGFDGATRVLFGSPPGTALHVGSGSTLTVVAPLGNPGSVDVRVVTPYGTSATVPADAFGYVG